MAANTLIVRTLKYACVTRYAVFVPAIWRKIKALHSIPVKATLYFLKFPPKFL